MRKTLTLSLILWLGFNHANAQKYAESIHWSKDGNSHYTIEEFQILKTHFPDLKKSVVVSNQFLKSGNQQINTIENFDEGVDSTQFLIFGNAQKVWRYKTKGDYWIVDAKTNQTKALGKNLPSASLMFAKISPDGKKAAYVSQHNVYVEDLNSGNITQLTTDGSDKIINGTFDWAYEEEFGCRDGFRWSPDSKHIAFWQIDASKIRNFLMINTTDSIYSHTIPVEYPKVGQSPSSAKIGIINVDSKAINWVQIDGDPSENYIPRMEWAQNNDEIILQQLNREQNVSKIWLANIQDGKAKTIFTETDDAWIDVKSRWNDDDPRGWEWIDGGKSFLWLSEKDGWRHLYKITHDGKKVELITAGDYDVMKINAIDAQKNWVYFSASPNNATQQYLYKINIKANAKAEIITPMVLAGTHDYDISTNGKYALHSFTNLQTPETYEWMRLRENVPFTMQGSITSQIAQRKPTKSTSEFIKIKLDDGTVLDAWMKKPTNFDPRKKYPIIYYVYGEPGSQTVNDSFGSDYNFLYNGNTADDGYITCSIENRGTPAPKGRAWRKSIFKNIGILNVKDQAMGAKKMFEMFPFIDQNRVAVWGWSGGGSSTLNLLFQYGDIYKTGVAIAALGNQLTYDNIYQERYMGSPLKTTEAYVKGSPVTYAKNLKGNLLYIHGSGDDNVHYQNAEMLLNELIKYNKQFQFMEYPNRTHSINEGEGTTEHLKSLYTKYMKTYCPQGAK